MSTANKKPTESVSLNAFKQPKAFYLIFSIELWERFGFYGLQGIMAVYLVKQLGMSEADSITLFSSFSALVYGLVAIGGWLGDKVLGTKRVIMLGGRRSRHRLRFSRMVRPRRRYRLYGHGGDCRG